MHWVVILQNGRGPPAPEVVSGEWRRSQPSSSDKTRAVHVRSSRPGKLGATTHPPPAAAAKSELRNQNLRRVELCKQWKWQLSLFHGW